MVAHAAAALEAEEEAGVQGLVCPTPLGTYRYRKRQKNGASLMIDVEVFPLAVNRELDAWKEQGERERRWVSLPEAASMVDEPDLSDLIRSFGPSEFKAATRRTGIVAATQSRISPMFAWFQRLLPKTGNFFEMFEAHAQTVTAAADALSRLLQDGSAAPDHIREVIEREHDADEIIREVLTTVRQTFLTPFDRGAIISLIGALDDAIDEMQSTVRAIDLYEVTAFEPEMKDMAAIVVDAARLTDRLLGVDLSYRFTQAMRAIRELIGRGELGSIFAVDLTFHNAYGPDKAWFYDPDLAGGGCVMDLGIHLVDLADWIVGGAAGEIDARLYAQGQRLHSPVDTVEDYAVAQWCSDSGACVRMACSWRLPAGRDAIIEAAFYGTRGGAALRNVAGSFYDFTLERFDGTRSETLGSPPDAWGGRALVQWAQALAEDAGFDEECERLLRVARVADRIYGR